MTEEENQRSLLKRVFGSKFFKLIEIAILSFIVFIGINHLTHSGDISSANMALSLISAATAVEAINIPKADRQINSIENGLYHFYYPLEDYIEGCLTGIEQDKKDIVEIGHYRRLAKKETRDKFEMYRNNGCKKEDCIDLLSYIKCDIDYYEGVLKKT